MKIGGQKIPTALVLLVAADCFLIVIGFLLATIIRFGAERGALFYYLSSRETLYRFVIATVICEISLYFHDLYDFRLIASTTALFVHLLQAFGFACLALAICYYIAPDIGFGRGIAIFSAPIVVSLTLGWRLVLLNHNEPLTAMERVLVMGTAPTGISLVRDIIHRPELNLKVVGFLDEKGENIGKSLVNPGIIGATADVESIMQKEKIDCLVVSLLERRGQMPIRQLLHLKFAGVRVEDAHSLCERLTGRINLDHLSPSWLIFSDGFRKSTLLIWFKRTFDIVVSAVALIACSPLFALVAALIWFESGWPILFRQERMGLNGRTFQIIKFRSMYRNAEENGPQWAAPADNRITKVGKWIRRTRIDELPQFLNVLRGEMSLIGPRPERPEFISLLEDQIAFYGLRHFVRPGITGWAQVKYQYGGSIEESKTKLEYDLFYIKHLSAMLDLAILFETAKVMITGRGAK